VDAVYPFAMPEYYHPQASTRAAVRTVYRSKVVMKGVWKEMMPDFRDHQLYPSKLGPVYWPTLFFPADRRINISYEKLVNNLRICGRWYYGCCIAMLFLGFLNCMTRCDYTIPIVVIGMIAYWMHDYHKEHPNYYYFEWPQYYKDKTDGVSLVPEPSKDKYAQNAVDIGFPQMNRLFYLRHCITAAELFLLSLIFSIVLDVLWIAVHGDYLRDYGALPYNVEFSIKAIVWVHKFVLGITICQLLLKLFSIYWIVWYIRFLCYIYWWLIPYKGKPPAQYREPEDPPAEIPFPSEPGKSETVHVPPSVQDL